jgi:hypothetical protein
MGEGAADLVDGIDPPNGDERLIRAHEVLRGGDVGNANQAVLTRLAPQFPPEEESGLGVTVLRDLLRIESRPARFRRLLRMWSGRVAGAIREGDIAGAEAWFRGLVERPTYPGSFADAVADALDGLSRPDLLDDLMRRLAGAGPGAGAGLVAAWGTRMVDYLVAGMAAEEPPVNRRHLVDCLGYVGREDVRPLAALVADHRWFIVRNLATALGRTGRPQAVPAVESLLMHPDDRVRVEALRALATLRRDESVPALVAALGDESPRVRHAATSLLRASASPEVVPGVVRVLESRNITASEGERLVAAIAERRDPAVRQALRRLAGRRMAVGVGRVVRDAARRALERQPA